MLLQRAQRYAAVMLAGLLASTGLALSARDARAAPSRPATVVLARRHQRHRPTPTHHRARHHHRIRHHHHRHNPVRLLKPIPPTPRPSPPATPPAGVPGGTAGTGSTDGAGGTNGAAGIDGVEEPAGLEEPARLEEPAGPEEPLVAGASVTAAPGYRQAVSRTCGSCRSRPAPRRSKSATPCRSPSWPRTTGPTPWKCGSPSPQTPPSRAPGAPPLRAAWNRASPIPAAPPPLPGPRLCRPRPGPSATRRASGRRLAQSPHLPNIDRTGRSPALPPEHPGRNADARRQQLHAGGRGHVH